MKHQHMEPEVARFGVRMLNGWQPVTQPSPEPFGEPVVTGVETIYEMVDLRASCELVRRLGEMADRCCVHPALDVRGSLVYVTVHTAGGMTTADFDFAWRVDLEIDPELGDLVAWQQEDLDVEPVLEGGDFYV